MSTERDTYLKLSAFRYYLDEGMEVVRRIYPAQVDFVESNKDKTYEQVEKELMAALSATA